MAGMSELMREYERTHFPPDRRLDVHGEGPSVARERALHWIRSRAHEEPGEELLLIAERGSRPGGRPSPVAMEVRKLLVELDGKLIEWWQPFTPGSFALRIAREPSVLPSRQPAPVAIGEGRTPETTGAARPSPRVDVPSELLEGVVRAAELRIDREGHSARLLDVLLREVWIEVQALAMERRMSFSDALDLVVRREAAIAASET